MLNNLKMLLAKWKKSLAFSKNKQLENVPYQVGIRKLSDSFIYILSCSFNLGDKPQY